MCVRYDTPIYTPVHRCKISYIKIDITDDTRKRIPFQAGENSDTSSEKTGLHTRELTINNTITIKSEVDNIFTRVDGIR